MKKYSEQNEYFSNHRIIFLGNLLILLNFLIPLKSNFVLVISFLLLSLNLLDFSFRLKIDYLNLIHLFVSVNFNFSCMEPTFYYDGVLPFAIQS